MRKSACAIALALSLAAGGFSSAAFAATQNSLSPDEASSLCSKLSDQFNGLKPFKQGLPYWQASAATFKVGKADCDNGKPVKGAEAMQTAISDLYVAPDTL